MGTDVAYSIAQLALLRDPYALAKMSSGVKLSTQVEQNFGLVSLGGDMQKEMENFQRAITVDNIGSISYSYLATREDGLLDPYLIYYLL
mgnify:CR=1 FL=1